MDKRDVQISKTLSYLLRHGAEKEKLPIDSLGWIQLSSLLAHNRLKTHRATPQDIDRVVSENAKQRFLLKEEEGMTYICANQGHTLKSVTPELELLTASTMPANVYHGTFKQKLDAIKSQGLSRMSRNHIHFTSDAEWSKLGIRPNCTVLIYVDTAKLTEDGYKLYRSRNGVILCSGNEEGTIPSYYFLQIVDRDTGRGK